MKKLTSFLMIAVTVMVCGVTLHAQELEATVTVNMEMLEMDDRVDVRMMQSDVRQYLNNQRYTGYEWDGPRIPIDVTIYLTGRSGNQYTARLAVVSRRLANNEPNTGAPLLRMFDQNWIFTFTFNPALGFQTMRYDEFTSLLDFYALLAIGLDMDTYDDLGGNVAFDAAKMIAGPRQCAWYL